MMNTIYKVISYSPILGPIIFFNLVYYKYIASNYLLYYRNLGRRDSGNILQLKIRFSFLNTS